MYEILAAFSYFETFLRVFDSILIAIELIIYIKKNLKK